MKRQDFEWTSKTVEHGERGMDGGAPLAMRALGVVYKHFLVPMGDYDLVGWKQYDHYRYRISELEDDPGDEVWIRPWIAGGWLDDRECLLRFEPTELNEEVFGASRWAEFMSWKQHRQRGVLPGFYLTVMRRNSGWSAVFAFRVHDRPEAEKLEELSIAEALCLSIDGDVTTVENWLEWAYKQRS